MLVTAFFALDKGFDISDESYYLLAYRFPQFHPISASLYNIILNSVIPFDYLELLPLRTLRLIFALVSSGLLAGAIKVTLPSKNFLLTFFIVLAGTLGGYSVFPQTTSYNDQIHLLVSAFVFIAVMAVKNRPGNWQVVLSIFGGIVVALATGIKISSGVLLLAASVFLCFRLVFKAVGFFSGFTLTLGIFMLRLSEISPSSAQKTASNVGAVTEGHNPFQILQNYLNDINRGAVVFLKHGLAILVFLIVKKIAARFFKKPEAVTAISAVALVVTALFTGLIFPNTRPYDVLGTVVTVMTVIIFQWFSSQEKNERWMSTLLCVLPFVAAVGTSNNIIVQCLFHMGFFFAAIATLSNQKKSLSLVAPIMAILVAWLIQGRFMKEMPYRLVTSLSAQTEYVENLQVYVDKRTKDFLTTLDSVIHQDEAKYRPVLVFFDMPGLVYYLNGFSPGEPWYYSGLLGRACTAIKTIPSQFRDIKVILTDDRLPDQVRDCLSEIGIRFPEDYTEVAELTNPYKPRLPVKIWKQKQFAPPAG